MKLKRKKGFTIVELVIVVAIIAILAAVLIPTFSNLVKKANQSADTQLVKNLNTILITEAATGDKNTTCYEAIQDVANSGYNVDKLTPTSDGEILWDSVNDYFVYENSNGEIVYVGATEPETRPAKVAYFKIYNEKVKYIGNESSYSVYLGTGAWDGSKTISATVGLDVGDYDFDNVTYSNETATEGVIIRTNYEGTKVHINAPEGAVTVYGKGSLINNSATTENSLHVRGEFNTVIISKGRVVFETEARSKTVVPAANDIIIGYSEGLATNYYPQTRRKEGITSYKIQDTDKTTSKSTNQSIVVINSEGKLESVNADGNNTAVSVAVQKAQGTIGEISASVAEETINNAISESSTVAGGLGILDDPYIICNIDQFNNIVQYGDLSGSITWNEGPITYYKLICDITVDNNPIIGSDISLDLNSHTITCGSIAIDSYGARNVAIFNGTVIGSSSDFGAITIMGENFGTEVSLTDLTITNPVNFGIEVKDFAIVTVNSCEITATGYQGAGIVVSYNSASTQQYNAELTVADSEITGKVAGIISTNASKISVSNSKLNVTANNQTKGEGFKATNKSIKMDISITDNCEINGNFDAAVYIGNAETVKIDSAKVTVTGPNGYDCGIQIFIADKASVTNSTINAAGDGLYFAYCKEIVAKDCNITTTAGTGAFWIENNTESAIVENLVIDASGYGMIIHTDTFNGINKDTGEKYPTIIENKNVIIKNCIVKSGSSENMSVFHTENSHDVTVENCEFYGKGTDTWVLDIETNSQNIIFKNCNISGGAIALYLCNTSTATSPSMKIESGSVQGNILIELNENCGDVILEISGGTYTVDPTKINKVTYASDETQSTEVVNCVKDGTVTANDESNPTVWTVVANS